MGGAEPIPLAATAHPIKAVTVFTSRKAEVVRTFAVDLVAGQNELAITGLPSCIDTDSARVTGLGDAVLFDVVCTVADARDADAQPAARDDTLKTLERRRNVLQGEKALRGRAADVLIQYGLSLNAENTPVDVVSTFMDSMVGRGSTTLEQIASLDEQLAEVEKEIEKEKRRLEKERLKAPALGRVSTVIMAKRAGKVEVTLTYMVSNVVWSPSYDLRATTEDGKPLSTVSFHYRASIMQNTGEDWRDTAISVSTASPGSWSNIPKLREMKIAPPVTTFAGAKFAQTQNTNTNTNNVFSSGSGGLFGSQNSNTNTNALPPTSGFLFGAPQTAPRPTFGATSSFGAAASTSSVLFGQSTQAAPSSGAFGSTQPTGSAPAFGFGRFAPTSTSNLPAESSDGWTPVEPVEAPEPDAGAGEDGKESAWAETKAVVTEGAVASAFRIEGNCTIPSEPTAHKVAIAILAFEAKVDYIAVPRSAPVAFLQCEVKNTSEYRLLPGPVNVFLDNSPASKTSIGDVSPEEVFKCTLGPDPSLRIKCTRLPPVITSSGSAYAAKTTVTTYKISTLVHNTHGFAIKNLLVRDAAPVGTQSSEFAFGDVPGISVVLKRPVGLGEAAADALVDVAVGKGRSTVVKVRWARGGHEKDGKYVWVVDVGAGEEVKLEAEYEVRAPSDYKWILRETPF